ncbi:Fe2+ or Zn2+ uptake regulation protein Fur/Zur, partial [Dysosmobacter welbionis]
GLPGRGRGHPVGPAAGGLRRGRDHRSGEGQGRLHRPGAVQEDAGRHRPGGHRVIGRQHRIVPGHGCVRLRPLPVCGCRPAAGPPHPCGEGHQRALQAGGLYHHPHPLHQGHRAHDRRQGHRRHETGRPVHQP